MLLIMKNKIFSILGIVFFVLAIYLQKEESPYSVYGYFLTIFFLLLNVFLKYGINEVVLRILFILIVIAPIVLIPKYFGYNSKYIILSILIIVAVIINVKTFREYFKTKILNILDKFKNK